MVSLADRAEAQGKPAQAAAYLSRYLGYAPEDAAILVRYATLLDNLAASAKSRSSAVYALEAALRRDPRNEAVRRRVIRDCLELQQFAVAGKHLQILLEAHPHDPQMLEMLGTCYAKTGELQKAAATLEKAIQRQPHNVSAHAELAGLLQTRLGQRQRAAKVLDAMVEANPQSFSAYLTRAWHWLGERAFSKAALDLRKARELAPDDADVVAAECELAQHTGWSTALHARLTGCLQKHPRDQRLHTALARLELSTGKREAGIASLRSSLQIVPGQPDLLAMLAETCIQDGKLDEAAHLITAMTQNGGSAAVGDYLTARIFLQQSRFAESVKLLQTLSGRLAAWPQLACRAELELAGCCAQLGDAEGRSLACERAVSAAPASAAARYALAAALLAKGHYEAAATQYRQCLALADSPADTPRALAQALIERNQQLPPNRRNWQEVAALLDRAEKVAAGSAFLVILRAETTAGQGDLAQARRSIEKGIASKPRSLELRLALARLLWRSGKPAEAALALRTAREQLGDDPRLRVALAQQVSLRDRASAEKSLAQLAAGIDRFSVEQRLWLLRELAELAYQAGAASPTQTLCRKIIELNPADKRSRLLLFDVALQSGAERQLITALADLRRIEGDGGAFWKCGDAARLMLSARRGNQADAAAARGRLAEVALERPQWSYVPLLRGVLEEIEGRTPQTIDCYLEAIDKGEQRPQVLYRTAQLLNNRGRYREAEQMIHRLEAQAPLVGDHARLAADIALHLKSPQRALELARSALAASSADYRDYLWLARIMEAAGKTADAHATLRKAVAQGRNIPDTWAELAEFVARTQSKEKAEGVLQQARAALSADRVPLASARYYEAAGDIARAEEQYRALLQKDPDNLSNHQALASFYFRTDQAARAEQHLRRLTSVAGTTLPADQRIQARRQLAFLLSADDVRARLAEARALIDANLALNPASPRDRRLRAMLDATNPDHRQEALIIIEQTVNQEPLSVEEQCRLAQLYEKLGDRIRAREQLRGLLTVEKPKPAYIALFTHFLARQGDLHEAQRWLAQLEKLEPNSPQSRAARAYLSEQTKARQER
jgi:predicted Zn-dependent protease